MSTPFHLLLPRTFLEEMLAQARAEVPNECCGLLAGKRFPDGEPPVARILQRYPLVNATRSPTEYVSESRSLLEAFRDMREKGLEILAIYHSHPNSGPIPSRTDLERNYYGSEVVHFIISLLTEPPRVRGWWLGENDFREARWEGVE